MMNKKNRKIFLICIIIAAVLLAFSAYFYIKASSKKEVLIFNEKSTAEYTVCLSENEYYKETCLGEEKEYLKVLTNEIRVMFGYSRVYGKGVDSTIKYHIGSKLIIYNKENNREIYTDEKDLTEVKEYKGEKEVNNIQDMVTIKFDDYASLVNKYVMDYSINSKAELEVYLLLGEGEEQTKVATVTIPLLEQTYSIAKDLVDNTASENIDEGYKNYLFTSILLIVLDVIFVIVVIIRYFQNSEDDAFEAEVKRILTDYDRIVVETKSNMINLEGKQITELGSFIELIDVRDTLEKPILYVKQDEGVRDFIVQDRDVVYRYRMMKNYDGGE